MIAISDRVLNTTESYKNNTMQIVVFELTMNNTKFGINVNKVKFFIRYKDIKIVELINKQNLQRSFCMIREKTYPLIYLESWLGEERNEEEYNVIILAEYNKSHIAFPVKKIYRIFNKENSQLKRSDLIKNKITYITKIDLSNKKDNEDNQLCMVLDVEKLLYEIKGTGEIEDSILRMKKSKFAKEILIAEDSSIAIEIINKILTKIGVKFHIFDNGKKLIDHIEGLNDEKLSEIGVILTDIEMPIKDGFQVLQHMKKEQKLKNIPIIVNSSMSNKGVKQKCKALGAEQFIEKTEPKTIRNLVEKYCL